MSAMECANHCGLLYERDGKWWCLNNYCEHSYFWPRVDKEEQRREAECQAMMHM